MYSDNKDSTVFNDPKCLAEPKQFLSFSVMVTIGYLIYDMLLAYFIV